MEEKKTQDQKNKDLRKVWDALKFDTDYTSFLFPSASNENLAREIIKDKNIFLRNAAVHFWMNKDCIIELKRINDKTRVISTILEKKE